MNPPIYVRRKPRSVLNVLFAAIQFALHNPNWPHPLRYYAKRDNDGNYAIRLPA